MDFKDGVNKYNLFISLHRLQLESSGVPQEFWMTLFKKLEYEVFDAGNAFSIFKIEYEPNEKTIEDPVYTVYVTNEDGVNCNDVAQIYLIDHAWTYEINNAVANLSQIPGLLDRMCNLMGIPISDPPEEKIENVCKEMWKFNQTYSQGFGTAEQRTPVWYIMDEFGSAIEHSDEPNVRIVPFYNLFNQTTYSLLFPIRNIDFNEKVTRDFLEGLCGKIESKRKALLIPWKPASFLNVNFLQDEDEDCFVKMNETLPSDQNMFQHNIKRVFKVYSDYDLVNTYLTHPSFEIIDEDRRNEADIFWLTSHFKDYKKLQEETPEKYINQFPCEHVLTMKNLFSIICRKKEIKGLDQYVDNPPWYPTAYNLNTNLVKFVSYFQHQEANGIQNLWICKPWNLARGLDTIITSNLNCILRLPSSGPKIAQRYISTPILFHRSDVGLVKFDIRYVVLLKSIEPLCVYVYKNFFLRFANKPYSLTDFWGREKHFTVMNYNDDTPLFKMLCNEFILKFKEQYPQHDWNKIEESIFHIIKEIFQAASSKSPPSGIGHNVQSRALYAVDLILSSEKANGNSEVVQPKILEVNWMPDCKRACEYYPTFFNEVFLLLFKNVEDESKFQIL